MTSLVGTDAAESKRNFMNWIDCLVRRHCKTDDIFVKKFNEDRIFGLFHQMQRTELAELTKLFTTPDFITWQTACFTNNVSAGIWVEVMKGGRGEIMMTNFNLGPFIG